MAGSKWVLDQGDLLPYGLGAGHAHQHFCLFQWLLDLGGSSVRGKRSLADELLQALAFGLAEPFLNYLWKEN